MKITDRIKKFMNRNNPELIAGETKLDKKINEKANEIEKLYQAYENILEQVVKEKIKNVSEIKIISEKEEKNIY